VTPEKGDRFHAHLGGRLLCTSRQPFLDAARVLLGEGHNPATVLVMLHGGTESPRSTIGHAAALTVKEPDRGRPHFARYVPLSSPAAPPIDLESERLPELPDAPEIAPADVPARAGVPRAAP